MSLTDSRCLQQGVELIVNLSKMDGEWKKGDICLAPSRQTDRYVTSEITDILRNQSGRTAAAFTHLGASSTGPELTDIALLLEVPQEHHRPVSWKSDNLCLVRVDRYQFRLAKIKHVEAEVAIVKFHSVFTEQISEEKEVVLITCLYRVVKKRKPQKKKRIGLGKKLGFGLAGAIGMAVLAPIAVPIAVGALGFGAGGIIAGTPAAAIMASYGGAVTAGSACAIMQSIGAAGLSATGALISGTVGGLVGGAAGVAAGAAADRKDKKLGKQEQEPPTAQLL